MNQRISSLAYLLAITLIVCVPLSTQAATFFSDARHHYVSGKATQTRHVIRQMQITANLNYLLGPANDGIDTLAVTLFDNTHLIAKRQRFERRSGSDYTWIGSLGPNTDEMVLTVVDGKLAGSIFHKGQIYRVRGLDDKTYELAQVDQHSFQEMRDDFDRPQYAPWKPAKIGPDLKQRSTIDIAFVYTNNASVLVPNMLAEIQHAVDLTNVAFMRSHIDVVLRLKGTTNTWYTSFGSDLTTDLDQLQHTSDGHLDSIHAFRDDPGVRADLVTLVVDAGPNGYCGRGFQNDDPWLRTADRGFNVVNIRCMVDNLSLAHEVGHNLGAGHDWAANDKPGSNHGKILPFNQRRTMMAYWRSCPELNYNCPKVLNFSNPDIILNSEPTGNSAMHAEPADNRKKINANRGYISQFR